MVSKARDKRIFRHPSPSINLNIVSALCDSQKHEVNPAFSRIRSCGEIFFVIEKSTMLDIESKTESKAKCYFAHTVLPHFIDNQQPPTKRKPFSTINAQAFNHTVSPLLMIKLSKGRNG